MCLINFAYKIDPRYPLIIAANRDEFYKRPTAPAMFWEDAPHVLAGRDLEKMGTWMGVTKQGRFAALTNFREPNQASDQLRSRGELVSGFLREKVHPKEYLKKIQLNRKEYPGFNLVIGDVDSLFYYSNVEDQVKHLQPGIYGLSNHLLNTPWPKVRKGKAGLERCLKHSGPDLEECLFSSLQYADPAPDEELPSTGVSLEWERKLSPLFIQTPDYGTRSSTLLFMNHERTKFIERTFKRNEYNERKFSFQVESL